MPLTPEQIARRDAEQLAQRGREIQADARRNRYQYPFIEQGPGGMPQPLPFLVDPISRPPGEPRFVRWLMRLAARLHHLD